MVWKNVREKSNLEIPKLSYFTTSRLNFNLRFQESNSYYFLGVYKWGLESDLMEIGIKQSGWLELASLKSIYRGLALTSFFC